MYALKISLYASALSLTAMISCVKGGGDSQLPALSIADVSMDRTTAGSTYSFTVSLSKPATSEVSINYTTTPATALENKDYTPTSGILKIPANTLSGIISVDVKGDSTRKEDQYFNVILSAPVNCALADDKGVGEIVNANGLYLPVDNTGYDVKDGYMFYRLAWSDEFNGGAIDPNIWSFEKGNNNGWGNAELEYYTDRPQNAFVSSNGYLVLEARKEALNGFQYTSARMVSYNKAAFQNGRIDIRAKTPTTKGIWPALWMLGINFKEVGWPACGEIDIMEQLGQQSSKSYGALHWGPNTAGHQSATGNVVLAGGYDKEFHVYSIDWHENNIQFFVDNIKYFEVPATQINGNNPFLHPFYFILNIAVGGNWPGAPDGTTLFPQRMIVDYIRVYI